LHFLDEFEFLDGLEMTSVVDRMIHEAPFLHVSVINEVGEEALGIREAGHHAHDL
jgi:hypothetical protein